MNTPLSIIFYPVQRKEIEPPFVILCDRLEDPHNLGALIRSAEAAGCHGLIIPKRHSAALSMTVAKASAGALEYLPVARVSNLAATLDELKKQGFWIYGADMDGQPWCKVDYAGAVALVIGSEGNGLSRLCRRMRRYCLPPHARENQFSQRIRRRWNPHVRGCSSTPSTRLRKEVAAMANSAIKPAGDWNLDEILADVRRMRGETSSPSGKNAPDRVEQILAELRAQPLGSAIRSNSTIQHTAAKHTAMSPLTTSRTSVAQDDIAPAQRPRQAAVSPPEDQSVNRRPSEKNEHISVPNQVVSSNSAKRGASVKTLSSTTAPDRSRPSRNNSEKSAAPVPKHRITPDEILHDMPSAASVQGKRRPNTIFEEIKRQAAKEQKRKPVSEPDVIYRKKVSQATAVSKSALEHTNDPVDSAPTRIDIPLASSPSRQERTRVLSPDQDSLSRPADVFTGQVPLPGFDESPSISKEQDDVWEKQLREARSKRVQNFVLSGQEEDNEPEENPEVTDDMVAIDDYESIDDAPVIRMDLMARRRSVGLRLGITLLIEAILLLLSAHTLFFSDFFSSVLTMPIKLILNAVLTALVVLINASTVFGGLGGLFRLNVDLDTGAAVSMLAALLHNVIMLCVTDAFVASGLYVYNAAAVLALVCNLWGKWSMISRIEHNFELVGNENPKKAAVLLENSKEAEEIGHGISIGESLVCCDRDTVTIARYLDHSYVQDPADESARKARSIHSGRRSCRRCVGLFYRVRQLSGLDICHHCF